MFKLLEPNIIPSSWNTYGEYALQYPPGQWVEAHPEAQEHGYHILVFDTLDHAMAYYASMFSEIWECEVEGEVELPPQLDPISLSNNGFEDAMPGDGWPDGTRMFKRIKLTRRIK